MSGEFSGPPPEDIELSEYERQALIASEWDAGAVETELPTQNPMTQDITFTADDDGGAYDNV